jgi:protocatechuate 3,4-dioxygenase beta subunit
MFTKLIAIVILTTFFSSCANSQDPVEGKGRLRGACEGCEGVFEYGGKKLKAVDTLPAYYERGDKLKVTGTIYQPDGATPAKDVILYIYHTNTGGIYPTRGGETGWARRHGYIRGWVKTGSDGVYTFYTTKPGAYPDGNNPAHIHPTILEPNGTYYWVEEYRFRGDPLLVNVPEPSSPRGGTTGVVAVEKEGGLLVAKRDFILGRGVPGY